MYKAQCLYYTHTLSLSLFLSLPPSLPPSLPHAGHALLQCPRGDLLFGSVSRHKRPVVTCAHACSRRMRIGRLGLGGRRAEG